MLEMSGQLHAPGHFTPGERAHGTHLTGGWVGPRAGLDDMEKWKFLPPPGLKLRPLGRPARSQYGPFFKYLLCILKFWQCKMQSQSISRDLKAKETFSGLFRERV
jgi:hypothetical protein